jgi:hypothetical protein
MEINLSHLESFDAELKAKVKSNPATYLPIVRIAHTQASLKAQLE